MKDILIGATDNLTWTQLRPWVKSIRETGFQGDVYLICYRVDNEVLTECAAHHVETYIVNHDPYGKPLQHGGYTLAHNMRFYHAWELLTRLRGVEEYEHVIMTDVRDVIFQRNPSAPLRSLLWEGDRHILAASEFIQFKNESWNKDNLIQGFGPLFYELQKADEWTAYNVGTIGGQVDYMADLFHTLFRMTENRYYPADQSSFNILIHGPLFDSVVFENWSWAGNLGTTQDPTKSHLWPHVTTRPTIRADNVVVNPVGTPYVMIHQWDRVPQLKETLAHKYS